MAIVAAELYPWKSTDNKKTATKPTTLDTHQVNTQPTNYTTPSDKSTGGNTGTPAKETSKKTNPIAGLMDTANAMGNAVKDAAQGKDTVGNDFTKSPQYLEATAKIESLMNDLRNIDTSRLDDIMNQIRDRGAFTYDASKDQLWQNALASGMKSGQQAMADTMGQAAALTGGYGSSYATQAGARAYSDVINNVYAQLPEYYQLALDAYEREGNRLNNLYEMERGAVNDKKSDLQYEVGINQDMLGLNKDAFYQTIGANQTDRAYERGVFESDRNYEHMLEREAVDDSHWNDEFGLKQKSTDADIAQGWARINQSAKVHEDSMNIQREKLALEKQSYADAQTQQAYENTINETNMYLKNGYMLDANGNWVKDPTASSSSTKSNLKENDSNLPKVKNSAVEAYVTGGQQALDDLINRYEGYYTEDTLNSIYDYVMGNSSSQDMKKQYTYAGSSWGKVSLKDSTGKTISNKDIDNLNISDEGKKILKGLKENQSVDLATMQLADHNTGELIDLRTGKKIADIKKVTK